MAYQAASKTAERNRHIGFGCVIRAREVLNLVGIDRLPLLQADDDFRVDHAKRPGHVSMEYLPTPWWIYVLIGPAICAL